MHPKQHDRARIPFVSFVHFVVEEMDYEVRWKAGPARLLSVFFYHEMHERHERKSLSSLTSQRGTAPLEF